jgi:hypothetical protein
MIARRLAVDTVRRDFLRNLLGQPKAPGGVFHIGDNEVILYMLSAALGEISGKRGAARLTGDIAHEEDLHLYPFPERFIDGSA